MRTVSRFGLVPDKSLAVVTALVCGITLLPGSWDAARWGIRYPTSLLALGSVWVLLLFVVARRGTIRTTPGLPWLYALSAMIVAHGVVLQPVVGPGTEAGAFVLSQPTALALQFLIPVGVYLGVVQSDADTRGVPLAAKMLVIVGGIHIGLGVLFAVAPGWASSVAPFEVVEESVLRLRSQLGTGGLAVLLMTTVPLAAAFAISPTHRADRAFGVTLLVFLSTGLLLTNSRAQVIALVLSTLLVLFVSLVTWRRSAMIRGWRWALVGVVAVTVSWFVAVRVGALSLMDPGRLLRLGVRSDHSRLERWQTLWGRLNERPLVGHGWGRGRSGELAEGATSLRGVGLLDPHSVLGVAMEEMGLLGAIIILGLGTSVAAIVFRTVKGAHKRERPCNVLCIAFSISLLAVVIHSLVSSQLLHFPRTSAVMWLVGGIVVAYSRSVPPEHPPREVRA